MQWEFAGRLGPDPGRYVLRRFAGDDVRHVLVVGGIEAQRRRRRGARPPRAGEPRSVEVTRATVIDAAPLADPEAWLEGAGEAVAAALAVLVRAVAAHRIGAADPWQPDPDPARALACRVGYGSGEQVAEGDWEAARDLAPPAARASRSRLLAPQERVAALLSGRDAALACEELVLRARGDLDHGRPREAALQASAALDAAAGELAAWPELSDRVAELARHRDAVAAAARAAVAGTLDERAIAAVGAAVERIEAALRARLVAARES